MQKETKFGEASKLGIPEFRNIRIGTIFNYRKSLVLEPKIIFVVIFQFSTRFWLNFNFNKISTLTVRIFFSNQLNEHTQAACFKRD